MAPSKRTHRRPKSQRSGEIRNIAPFPRRKSVVFRYAIPLFMDTLSAGVSALQLVNLNSLYDPDATAVGHQPLYYDQLLSSTGPYTRYVVTRTDVDVTINNRVNVQAYFAFYAQAGTVDSPSLIGLMEKPYTKGCLIGDATGAGCQKRLRASFHTHKVMGVPKRRVLDDDAFSGTWNTNPSLLVNLNCVLYGMPGETAAEKAMVVINLEMHAELYSLSAIATS